MYDLHFLFFHSTLAYFFYIFGVILLPSVCLSYSLLQGEINETSKYVLVNKGFAIFCCCKINLHILYTYQKDYEYFTALNLFDCRVSLHTDTIHQMKEGAQIFIE